MSNPLTQPDLAANLVGLRQQAKVLSQANRAKPPVGPKTDKKVGRKVVGQAGAAAGAAVAGPIGAGIGKVGGKIAGAALTKIAGESGNTFFWFLLALAVDGYGLAAPFIDTLSLGVSLIAEVPAEIATGFAFKYLLKDYLTQAPGLSKWIWIVTGLEVIPYLNALPMWTLLVVYASHRIKSAA